MTPEKIPMQDPGIWGYMGLIMGGFVSKVIQGDTVSWKTLAKIGGSIILILLSGAGTLSYLGIRNIQDNIIEMKLTSKETGNAVAALTTELRVSHTKVEEKNKNQDDCIARIEGLLDKMRGVKSPRLGGGDFGDE